jgi:hypothetical protein
MTPCFNNWRPCSIASHVDEPLPVNTVSIKKPLG